MKGQLQREANRLAAVIFTDLGLDKGPVDFATCWRLCQENGGDPKVIAALGRDCPGCCVKTVGSENAAMIALSGHLTLNEACSVMIHELVHRLAYSERYAEHNVRRFFAFDHDAFNEALARSVKRLFLLAGGTGLRPVRY